MIAYLLMLTTQKEIAVIVRPVADNPVLSVIENVSGDEDTFIPLTIQAELTDKDGSEKMIDITIAKFPGSLLNKTLKVPLGTTDNSLGFQPQAGEQFQAVELSLTAMGFSP